MIYLIFIKIGLIFKDHYRNERINIKCYFSKLS